MILSGDSDLFAFFTRVVTAAAEKKVVVELLALLTATAQGALRGGWSADLRERVLTRVFAGLVP